MGALWATFNVPKRVGLPKVPQEALPPETNSFLGPNWESVSEISLFVWGMFQNVFDEIQLIVYRFGRHVATQGGTFVTLVRPFGFSIIMQHFHATTCFPKVQEYQRNA